MDPTWKEFGKAQRRIRALRVFCHEPVFDRYAMQLLDDAKRQIQQEMRDARRNRGRRPNSSSQGRYGH
jgi:hypothetical protein